jgi:rubrerythrin
MERWNSVEEALDFAIENEEESQRFYTDLAGRAKQAWMRTTLEEFAQEELRHKEKLLQVKQGAVLKPTEQRILDLKLADYLVDVEPTPQLDYQQALVLAMKKEKAAFRLYTDIAAAVTEPALRDTFRALAQEEAKHKLRIEVEYDDVVLRDN